ncbi:MAG: hypothetical protein QNK37_04220 [Acidobacteriota bacterium]|nr:hypothetical protein [Acidobacteriota bacterium]
MEEIGAKVKSKMEDDPVALKYLLKSNGEPFYALALMDEYIESREIARSKSGSFLSLLKFGLEKGVIPVFIVFFGAYLGNNIANKLQENSYYRNTEFKAKLNKIESIHESSLSVSDKIYKEYIEILSNKARGRMAPRSQLSNLSSLSNKLNNLKYMADKIVVNSRSAEAISNVKLKLDIFILCQNIQYQRENKGKCNENFDLKLLEKMKHSTAEDVASFLDVYSSKKGKLSSFWGQIRREDQASTED